MASRQAFLKREPRKPAVRPERRERRMPGRPKARPAPRRAPAPMWRPAPKAPTPFAKPPKVGLPKPAFQAASPVARRALAGLRLARPLARLMPVLGWAMLVWDAYELYSWWSQQQEAGMYPPPSDHVVCSPDAGNRDIAYQWQGGPYCATYQPLTVPSSWHPTTPWYTRVERHRARPSTFPRWNQREHWYYPADPGVTPEWRPEIDIKMPLIVELPYPFPGAAMPYPVAPPLNDPESRPSPDPAPVVSAPPVSMPGRTPAIEIGADGRVGIGTHFQRPPWENEREKKKRLTGSAARAWLRLLEATGGSFMEKDDIVAAMYKGLPWKLRRWRGKDGVWRDRDHTTTRRLSRLFGNLGSLDVGTALTEVAKNELGDAIYGRLGKALKDRTQQLAEQGLWSGSRGLGQGTPLEDSWDETYKRLKAEAASRDPARWYLAKHYDAKNGVWVRKWRQRPVTSIPWLRNRSRFDRRFTSYAYGGKPQTRPRYYYGAAHQPKGGLPNGKEK